MAWWLSDLGGWVQRRGRVYAGISPAELSGEAECAVGTLCTQEQLTHVHTLSIRNHWVGDGRHQGRSEAMWIHE